MSDDGDTENLVKEEEQEQNGDGQQSPDKQVAGQSGKEESGRGNGNGNGNGQKDADGDESSTKEDDYTDARKVFIRVVFLKMGDIDTVNEIFQSDVFIQARWKEPTLDGKDPSSVDPMSMDDLWRPQLTVDNITDKSGNLTAMSSSVVVVDGDSYVVERYRIQGTFHETMELYRFPFDTQDLAVTVLSGLPSEEVQLVEDPLQSSVINVDAFTDVQEWRLYNVVQTTSGQMTRFGLTGESKQQAYVMCRANVARKIGYYVTNIFITSFLIVGLVFTTFATSYENSSSRVASVLTLILTSVAYRFSIAGTLPRISYLTTVDVYLSASTLMLVLLAVWNSLVGILISKRGASFTKRVDDCVFVLFGGAYLIGHVLFVCFVGTRKCLRNRHFEKLSAEHQAKIELQEESSSNAPSIVVQ